MRSPSYFEHMSDNPIDKDKTTDSPGTLPYAHHVGSVSIKPADKGRIKGRALAAMYEQTETQLDQIKEQMKLLVDQADKLKERVEVSERIYQADMGFEPVVGKTYYLYERANGRYVVSLVGPDQWGRTSPFRAFLGGVRLLADHTWEVLDEG